MMQAILAAAAIVVGLLLGVFIRARVAQSEKALLEQRNRESADAVTSLRSELATAQGEATRRAGFESVAAEREKTIATVIAEREIARQDLHASHGVSRDQAARISQLEADLNNERQKTPANLALLQDAQKTLAHQFEALAANVLDQKSKTFSEGSQKELGTLLSPLREQIKEFREKVEQAQSDSKTGVTKLETLIGTLNGLNQQLSDEARNLTTALRGSAKTQGDWGEFILRDLLDKAGLREGEQYSYQQTFAGIEGAHGERERSVRTDVVVSLPGSRHLVIDSKVSLTAYTDCVSAETEEARKAALKQHIASVRGHIAGLAKAGYHRLPELEAPDFVVMFVPIEPAFLMVLQADTELWADAYKQGILLVGPTTLLYVIRIVNVLWQQERQARNVREVMERGSELYEKFVGFVTDMEVIGDSLRKTDEHYTNAMKKLADGRGNLIRQVELLKKLGLRTTKSIPKKLLDRADVDQEELALSAEAEESPAN
ncbi:MAG TPA: DNA recombination protein RmuC [Terracidiphilus sp.]|jgi:DNA recombination protein RmuC|nr:DNA recombination protein RmuC [Terracidiphilus sp.]HEX4286106.1 DNA recombination protein RmuC [Terracidiphilus sp.]